MTKVEIKFQKAVKKFRLFENVNKVVCGFSGGSDSVTLLHLLSKCENLSVTAVHVNHMIRGKEADRDEIFCRDFCQKNGIEFISYRVDVPKISKELKKGLEETARIERYKIFDSVKNRIGADAIAVAHNANDNAETVIFNEIRGTSLNGLCGIKPKRNDIIRPLILCEKDEILEYCEENGLDFVTDSTNSDTEYTRNDIRKNVIPNLLRISPAAVSKISETSTALIDDNDFIEKEASKYSLKDKRSDLIGLHVSLLRRVVYNETTANGLSPERVHVEEFIDLLKSDKTEFEYDIPGGSVFVQRENIFFKRTEAVPEYKLHLGENVNFGERFYVGDDGKDTEKGVLISKDLLDKGLYVRRRLDGDVYYLGTLHKKVKKMLQGKKMTTEEKNALPVVVCEEKIIWIPGFCPSDYGKGENMIKISYIKETNEQK